MNPIQSHSPIIIFTDTSEIKRRVSQMVWENKKIVVHEFSKQFDLRIDSDVSQVWWIDDAQEVTLAKAKKFVKLTKKVNILSYVVFQQPFLSREASERKIGEELNIVTEFIKQTAPYTSLILYKGIFEEGFFSFKNQNGGVSFEYVLKEALDVGKSPRGGKRKIITPKNFSIDDIQFISEFSPVYLKENFKVEKSVPEVISHSHVDIVDTPESNLPRPEFKKIKIIQPEHPPVAEIKQSEVLRVRTNKPVWGEKEVLIPKATQPDIHRSRVVLHSISEKEVEKKITPWQQVGVDHPVKVISTPVAPQVNSQAFDKKFTNLFHQTLQPVEVDHEDLTKKLHIFAQPHPLKTKVVSKVKKRRKVLFYLFVFWLLSMGVLGSVVFANSFGKTNFVYFTQHLPVNESKSLRERAYFSSIAYLDSTQWILHPVVNDEEEKSIQKLIEASKALEDFFIARRKSSQILSEVGQEVMGYTDGDVFTSLDAFPALAEESYKKLSTLETLVKNPEYDDLLFGQDRSTFVKELTSLRKSLRIQQEIVQTLPELLGKDGKRIYSIFLQDSQESRPSGGKLMSMAVVTFEKGKLINYQIVPLSEMAELEELVDAPEEVKQYLQLEHWPINEANWEASFPQVGKHITWYLEKALSQSIDGVMVIPSVSFKNIIGPTHGISLPETGEVIDQKNFLEKVRFYTFQKRANPEPEFIAFLESFFSQLKTLESSSFGEVVGETYQELEKHEVSVYFKNEELQSMSTMLGWSGEILTPNCPAQIVQGTCTVSTFYETRTNIAKNKVSLDVTKTAVFDIDFQPEQTISNYDFSYKNISQQINWPGGVAQELIRIYVPKTVQLEELRIQDVVLTTDEYEEEIVGENKKIEFVVNIPPGSEVTGSMKYVQSNVELPFSYSFFVQKQPGILPVPTKIRYHYDLPFLPSVVAPEATILDKGAEFELSGEDHIFTGIKFR